MQRTPIIISGMPRSGNTWVARLLATAKGTALPGREPMNARGRQYALGHSIDGWVRLTTLTPRQRLIVRTAFAGLNPMVYSKYGRNQLSAPLPWVRNLVKDPFAMLSLPALVSETGARAVLVYRHPGGSLASYRRMGWEPDLEELAPVLRRFNDEVGASDQIAPMPTSAAVSAGEVTPAGAMGSFWNALHAMALADLRRTGLLDGRVLLVSHPELASAGQAGARVLFEALELKPSAETIAELTRESAPVADEALHNLERNPAEVAESWRRDVSQAEVDDLERVAGATYAALDEARLRLT